MERNIDRKTLSFGKGMTNVPSDLLSGDDELVESDGFIYRDGEMKPIQKPIKVGNIPYKIMYVHKGADFENLIAYDEASGTIYCYPMIDGKPDMESENIQNFSIGEVYDIKSVNNTLVCATRRGICYLNYKGKTYHNLGSNLPTIKFVPRLGYMNYASLGGTSVCKLEGMIENSYDKSKWAKAIYNSDGTLNRIEVSGNSAAPAPDNAYYGWKAINEVDKALAFKDATIGHYNAVLKKIKETNRFAFPFYVRYALKLYDGTYARISAPILMFPSITKNCKFVPVEYKNGDYVETEGKTTDFLAYINYATLQFRAEIDGLGNWGDIVKELVVFASDEVKVMDLEKGFKFVHATESNGEAYIDYVNSDWRYKIEQQIPGGGFFPTADTFKPVYKFSNTSYKARDVLMPAYYKTEAEIKDELLAKSQFYKLFSVRVDGDYVNNGLFADAPIGRHVVENLVTQEQLRTDDYYGWTSIFANKIHPYNKRLNVFDIKRSFFKGFNDLEQYSDIKTTKTFCYYTHIESNGTSAWVKSDDVSVFLPQAAATWLYYPDPNATEMIIWDNTSGSGMKVKLKEHPMLNGSYYFGSLPTIDTFVADSAIKNTPTITDGAVESFDSQIFTSVVNNPFVFEASGDNTVGTGRIIDIASNTEAISQGQFGQYPLLVFTSEGVYGLSVNSEGLYSASYPISREVCNDDSPIIPTDKLIFFASKKGLMATSGGTVACMSEQIRGRITRNFSQFVGESFLKFLEGSIIAYDYRDSLLRIFKPGQTHHYIYNMVDKTFAMVNDGIDVKAAVNNYPDNLIQDKDGNVYSLIGKPDINDDENAYSGSFVTRPLKLGGSLSLKSLRAIKNLVDSDNGKVKLEIWGSNDCKHWQKLSSIYGKPWKYFTFKYNITDFKATDSFAGSIVEIQTRREDKMR